MSVCQPRLGGNVIFSAPNWDIAPIFFVQIPLINELLFCKYFVRLSVGNATKGFATYGCFHPCLLLNIRSITNYFVRVSFCMYFFFQISVFHKFFLQFQTASLHTHVFFIFYCIDPQTKSFLAKGKGQLHPIVAQNFEVISKI